MKLKIVLLIFVITLSTSCSSIKGMFERGGTKYKIAVKTSVPDFRSVTDDAVVVLSSRLDALGVRSKVTQTMPDQIEVLAYGKFDAERIKGLLLAQGKLEFAKVAGDQFQTFPTKEAALHAMGGELPSNRRILPYAERDERSKDNKEQWIIVEDPAVIDGRSIRDARAYSPSGEGSDHDYQIAFKLDAEGAAKFSDWTGRNISKYLAIVLNDEVKSAPVIRGQIFDSGQIEGRFTKLAAEDLALVLKSGYLPATLTLLEESTFE